MISKEKFVEIIDRLREANDTVEKVNDILRNTRENIESDFMNGSALSISHEGIVVELLENMFDDYEIISWWAYEMDYGRKYVDGCFTEEDDTPIDVSTAGKLYDFLIRNKEESSKNE